MSNENPQGMINGIKHYTDNTVEAFKTTLKLVLSTGGDVNKSIDVTAHLVKVGSRALVDEELGGKSCAEITHGLAGLPPVPTLTQQGQPAQPNSATLLAESYFAEVNS